MLKFDHLLQLVDSNQNKVVNPMYATNFVLRLHRNVAVLLFKTIMKQFELKFYKEWYDALTELSHDDRANAVLALFEYLYDGIIPEDKFIRIVTTLMRNKIDRETAVYERKKIIPMLRIVRLTQTILQYQPTQHRLDK